MLQENKNPTIWVQPLSINPRVILLSRCVIPARISSKHRWCIRMFECLFACSPVGWPGCGSSVCLGGLSVILLPSATGVGKDRAVSSSARKLDTLRWSSSSSTAQGRSCTHCRTFPSLGSLTVQLRMSSADTGDSAKCSAKRINSGSTLVVAGVTGDWQR